MLYLLDMCSSLLSPCQWSFQRGYSSLTQIVSMVSSQCLARCMSCFQIYFANASSVGFVCTCVSDLDFLFHMFFLARYCKLLEETSFRGRTADFFFMLLFGGSLLTTLVVAGGQLKFGAPFADIIFLSNSLTFMMVCNLNFPCLFLQFSVSVIPERLFYLLVQDLRYCNSILIII